MVSFIYPIDGGTIIPEGWGLLTDIFTSLELFTFSLKLDDLCLYGSRDRGILKTYGSFAPGVY